MNIFYMIFGEKTVHHVQAYLSIRTFQKQLTEGDHIYVITTHPELYVASGATTIDIGDDTINTWKGKHDFFWRAKIKAIEYMAQHYPDDHLMYLDTDTILYGSLEQMKAGLDKGYGYMHINEGHPSEMKTKSLRMWHQIKGKNYGGVTMGKEHCMYNAGVVAIPKNKLLEVSEKALEICDGMLDDETERIVIEQYALSISLYECTSLHEADCFVGHYWGNKPEWEAIAYDLIVKAYMEQLTIEKAVERTDIMTMKRTPVYIHHSSTGNRLKRLISKLFIDKDQKYL